MGGGEGRPMLAKTAENVENHRKEGPINTTVGKSGIPCILGHSKMLFNFCIQINFSILMKVE